MRICLIGEFGKEVADLVEFQIFESKKNSWPLYFVSSGELEFLKFNYQEIKILSRARFVCFSAVENFHCCVRRTAYE